MKPQLSRPPMAPDTPAVMLPTDNHGTADAPMPTPELRLHRDYDGRGLGIGPLDHLDRIEGCERFAIR